MCVYNLAQSRAYQLAICRLGAYVHSESVPNLGNRETLTRTRSSHRILELQLRRLSLVLAAGLVQRLWGWRGRPQVGHTTGYHVGKLDPDDYIKPRKRIKSCVSIFPLDLDPFCLFVAAGHIYMHTAV